MDSKEAAPLEVPEAVAESTPPAEGPATREGGLAGIFKFRSER